MNRWERLRSLAGRWMRSRTAPALAILGLAAVIVGTDGSPAASGAPEAAVESSEAGIAAATRVHVQTTGNHSELVKKLPITRQRDDDFDCRDSEWILEYLSLTEMSGPSGPTPCKSARQSRHMVCLRPCAETDWRGAD